MRTFQSKLSTFVKGTRGAILALVAVSLLSAYAIASQVESWFAGLGWGIAIGGSGWFLLQARFTSSFRAWVRHPLIRPALDMGPWQKTAQRLYQSIQGGRSRSRSLAGMAMRLRHIADELPDAWVLLGDEGRVELFNRAAENMLGLKSADINQKLADLIREPVLSSMLAMGMKEEVFESTSPVDDRMQIEFRLFPTDQNQTIVVARNVTELNRFLSMRQQFLANVSHELRTPLTVILGYLEAIDADMELDTVLDLTKRLSSPVGRMKSLVEDLLTLTSLESAPLPTEEQIRKFEGARHLEEIVNEADQISAGSHKLILEADPSLVIEAVPEELHSAFMNLVTNAIRYSPDGGDVHVRWHAHEGKAKFEVEDQGVGIAPEHLSRLTERFYRVDVRGSRARGGTGLGLAIVKHVLRRHGTNLMIESKVGVGSKMYCVLPLSQHPRIST